MSVKDFYTREYDLKPKKKPSKMEYKGSTHTSNELYSVEAYSNRIVETYDFPEINKNSFLFIDSETKFNEVCYAIDFYLEVMETYGFGKELAIEIASDNTKLFMFGKEELERRLNILKGFALDYEMLMKNTIFNSINSKTLYNIIQYLRASGINITIEEIEKYYKSKRDSIVEFNIEIDKKRKNYISILSACGCTKEEAEFVLELNPYILKIEVGDLKKITAILWQYKLDLDVLTKSCELQKLSPQMIYSLTEVLKSMNLEVTEENILNLYMDSDKDMINEMARERKLTAGKMGIIYSNYYRR